MEKLEIGNRYLFDTCVFIEILRNRKPAKDFHYQRRFWQVYVGYSIISETELWKGLKGFRTEHQHLILLKAYRRYFINVTIARNAGLYWQSLYDEFKKNKTPLPPLEDCIIAATAKFYDLRLVTSDTNHMPLFEKFGVVIDTYKQE